MKRILAAFLCALLLAGCGREAAEPAGESQTDQELQTGSFSLGLATERQEYDPSVEEVWCVLSYEGEGDPLEFGAEYRLEVLKDGTWEKIPFAENVGWDDVLYTLPAGESWAFPCVLSQFDCEFTDGTYRVVKELGALPGQAELLPCEAEFTLRTGAAISAERPHGFAPLEDLPEDADLLAADTDLGDAVLFTDMGEENLSAAETFLEKVSLGIPCQLRSVQSYYESWPMVIDVIYEAAPYGDGSFLWRMRTDGEITEQRFSYIVTDGTDVYLSNGADWASTKGYDSNKAFLLPSGSGEFLTPAAEQMTKDRLAASTARYQVWSQDGAWCAQLTEIPTEFGVDWRKPGEGYDGRLYNLQDWDGLETAITGLEWLEDNTLYLICETADGGTSRLIFDPENTTLESA